MYLNPVLLQYVMLVFTERKEPVYCVQITRLNLLLVINQNVKTLVMENLIFLIMNIPHVVRNLSTSAHKGFTNLTKWWFFLYCPLKRYNLSLSDL